MAAMDASEAGEPRVFVCLKKGRAEEERKRRKR
jgi:hypothetical protein